MLTLGLDRDNEIVAPAYDERNPAVLWMIETAIKKAHRLGLTSSMCGQAPSTYPELTEKLIEWGITSVSVSPDVIDRVREVISEAENRLVKRRMTVHDRA
jgi:pyruvate,water dikinase